MTDSDRESERERMPGTSVECGIYDSFVYSLWQEVQSYWHLRQISQIYSGLPVNVQAYRCFILSIVFIVKGEKLQFTNSSLL